MEPEKSSVRCKVEHPFPIVKRHMGYAKVVYRRCFMIKLSTEFSEKERNVLLEFAGDDYEVLSNIEGDSYVLCETGNYSYNQCFHPTRIEFFAN